MTQDATHISIPPETLNFELLASRSKRTVNPSMDDIDFETILRNHVVTNHRWANVDAHRPNSFTHIWKVAEKVSRQAPMYGYRVPDIRFRDWLFTLPHERMDKLFSWSAWTRFFFLGSAIFGSDGRWCAPYMIYDDTGPGRWLKRDRALGSVWTKDDNAILIRKF